MSGNMHHLILEVDEYANECCAVGVDNNNLIFFDKIESEYNQAYKRGWERIHAIQATLYRRAENYVDSNHR